MAKPTKFTSLEATENFSNPAVDAALAAGLKFKKIGTVGFADTSATAKTLGTVPAGAMIVKFICDVTTAFNSGTSDTIAIGNADTANAYMATTDITTHTVGVYAKDVAVSVATELTVKSTLTKDGATAGVADIYALYFMK